MHFVLGLPSRMKPSEPRRAPPKTRPGFLRGAPFSLREPTSRPRKAAFGLIERAIAPEELNRRPLAARRHTNLFECGFAERKALGIEKLAQLAARHQWLGCRRG